MKKFLLDGAAVATTVTLLAVPASAGLLVPAPIAGVGIGALVVVAFGYRAIRKRIDG